MVSSRLKFLKQISETKMVLSDAEDQSAAEDQVLNIDTLALRL